MSNSSDSEGTFPPPIPFPLVESSEYTFRRRRSNSKEESRARDSDPGSKRKEGGGGVAVWARSPLLGAKTLPRGMAARRNGGEEDLADFGKTRNRDAAGNETRRNEERDSVEDAEVKNRDVADLAKRRMQKGDFGETWNDDGDSVDDAKMWSQEGDSVGDVGMADSLDGSLLERPPPRNSGNFQTRPPPRGMAPMPESKAQEDGYPAKRNPPSNPRGSILRSQDEDIVKETEDEYTTQDADDYSVRISDYAGNVAPALNMDEYSIKSIDEYRDKASTPQQDDGNSFDGYVETVPLEYSGRRKRSNSKEFLETNDVHEKEYMGRRKRSNSKEFVEANDVHEEEYMGRRKRSNSKEPVVSHDDDFDYDTHDDNHLDEVLVDNLSFDGMEDEGGPVAHDEIVDEEFSDWQSIGGGYDEVAGAAPIPLSPLFTRNPSKRSSSHFFETTTQEGWTAVRVGNRAWDERWCVVQPAKGLFSFKDQVEAHAWRRSMPDSKETKMPYDAHLLISCEGLIVVPSPDAAQEADEQTKGTYVAAVELKSKATSNDCVVLAFPNDVAALWISSLEGARPLADYYSECDRLQVEPSSALIRAALMSPPLRIIRSQDAESPANIKALCTFLSSTGENMQCLWLENTTSLGDESLLTVLSRDTLSKLTSLQDFSIENNPELGSHGLIRLIDDGFLKSRARLKSFQASKCSLGDTSADALCEWISKTSSFENLDLSRNNFTAVGGSRIALALSRSVDLEELSFEANVRLGDEFAFALASVLPSLSHLKQLNVRGCGVTNKGLAAIERGIILLDDVAFRTGDTDGLTMIDLRDNPRISMSAIQGFISRVGLLPEFVLNNASDEQLDNSLLLDQSYYDEQSSVLNTSLATMPSASLGINSRFIVRFTGVPYPEPSRFIQIVCSSLGLPKRRLELLDMNEDAMRIQVANDVDGSITRRICALTDTPRLSILRVQSIRSEQDEESLYGATKKNNSNELVSSFNRDADAGLDLQDDDDDDEEFQRQLALVSLDVVASSASECFFAFGSFDRLERDITNISSVSSPLLRDALEWVSLGKMNRPAMAASSGLGNLCDSLVATQIETTGEYDSVSAFQCAAVLGDLKRIKAACKRASDDQGFARRLGGIVLANFSFGGSAEQQRSHKLTSYSSNDDSVLKSYDRFVASDVRPLTLQSEYASASFEDHAYGCARVLNLIGQVLGHEERNVNDVDGVVAANELFGLALNNPDLIGEMHCDLVLRTALARRPKQVTSFVWTFAVTALRCVPPREEGLFSSLKAAYKSCWEKNQEPMALHAIRACLEEDSATLIPAYLLGQRPKMSDSFRRLDFVKASLRRMPVLISVNLPDGRAVVVDAAPFTTFFQLLIKVDERLGENPTFGLERWRGYNFYSSVKTRPVRRSSSSPNAATPGEQKSCLLSHGDDPAWWWHRSTNENEGETATLSLGCTVGPFFPLLCESDPLHTDEDLRGDAVRVDLAFAEEKKLVKEACAFADDAEQAVAYMSVVSALERMGEERFRECPTSELYHACEIQFPLTSTVDWASPAGMEKVFQFRNTVDRVRNELLNAPSGSLDRKTIRAAFTSYARAWPLSGASFFKVSPKAISSEGIVVDYSLPETATLVVGVRGVALLAGAGRDFRSCLWSCDLKSFSKVDFSSNVVARLIASNAGDWISIRFADPVKAKFANDVLIHHFWAVLGEAGVHASPSKCAREFAARFPVFPTPPQPPRFSVPFGGSLKTKSSKIAAQTRLAARVLVDALLRPRFKRESLPGGAFFYGPLQVGEIGASFSLGAMELALDFVEVSGGRFVDDSHFFLGGDASGSRIVFPVPDGPPPPFVEHVPQIVSNEDDIRPPSHPPPTMGGEAAAEIAVPGLALVAVGDEEDVKAKKKAEFLRRKHEREQAEASAATAGAAVLPVSIIELEVTVPLVTVLDPGMESSVADAKTKMKAEFLRRKHEREQTEAAVAHQ